MINLTPFARPYFALMAKRRAKYAGREGLRRTQLRLLDRLLRRADDTVYGRAYRFKNIHSYADFAAAVPAAEYEDIRTWVLRMMSGENDILWPGTTRRFAQSSGTSGGKSKYIPVTDDSLRLNHYAGGAEAVASYLNIYPGGRLFGGRAFILGGSFANELVGLPIDVKVGDLSANLIDAINPAVNLLRVPSKDIALMPDWTKKLPRLIEAAAKANVTNISGVPSWFLAVLRGVLEHTGRQSIHEVWPNLEVFFHGGIAFEPYRQQYDAICDPARMHYIENYNASEGFFAVQDTPEAAAGMLLLADHGVFYEFVPVGGAITDAVPAWEVEAGQCYAMYISSCNGLWRYCPGDTVRVESVEPLRISIAGRTNSYINAFGEELMVWNADQALTKACAKTGAAVADYTAAPVYTTDTDKGRHQWVIEWEHEPSCSIDEFAAILDAELQALNSDYQAKRAGDIFLAGPLLTIAPEGTFNRWLAATGRLGGQRKVPRLANDRHIIDQILNYLNN